IREGEVQPVRSEHGRRERADGPGPGNSGAAVESVSHMAGKSKRRASSPFFPAFRFCKGFPGYGIVSPIYAVVWSRSCSRRRLLMFKWVMPHAIVRTICAIDLPRLQEQGIRGIITDLDNTLVGAREPLATPELTEWLDRVREQGFRVVIVSNNNKTRV